MSIKWRDIFGESCNHHLLHFTPRKDVDQYQSNKRGGEKSLAQLLEEVESAEQDLVVANPGCNLD